MPQVIVATYPTRAEAQTVAQMLAGAGLNAVVVGDDAGGAIPHLTMGTRAPAVSVPADQESTAAELLDIDQAHAGRVDAAPNAHTTAQPHRWLSVAAAAVLTVIVLGIALSIVLS